ncbi:MAG: rhodanese-like domain-containing protein [Leptolyngbyaceae cyanobacterium CRU_2_3]|nr:rhodanese-like domain-containing protein [Leptolyngbyaceae cyanobacterium CRU_2_3]
MFWLGQSLFFNLLKRLIHYQFPDVRSLSTVDLSQWLETPAQPQPILLDARSQAEFAVSHLKTAWWIDPKMPDWKALAEFKGAAIVVYCSVGYRSARLAQQLQQAGFSNVLNLEGSLFQWANEGRPLVCEGHTTQVVHPYNTCWGLLLKPEHRLGEPDQETKASRNRGI